MKMDGLEKLVGRRVRKIFINSDFLKFETNHGDLCFVVEGDCCSSSYFHDFLGVEKLLKNRLVIAVETVNVGEDEDEDGDLLQKYGYRIITQDLTFGDVSSVFSFRNRSNGYYGGWMNETSSVPDDTPEITKDWIDD